MDIDIKNIDGLEYLETIDNNSIDLILTDPPYIISKDSGMNTHYKKNGKNINMIIILIMMIIKIIILNMEQYMVKNIVLKLIMENGIIILQWNYWKNLYVNIIKN